MLNQSNDGEAGRIVLAADNSQISTFLECPSKWNLGYRENLRRIGESEQAMDNGTVIHALLHVFYHHTALGESRDRAARWTLQKAEEKRDTKLVSDESYKFIRTRFLEYVTHYSMVNDFTAKVISGVPQVEIGFSVVLLDSPQYYFVVEGRIDLITNGDIFVDHKSQERIHNHYKFDTQFLTYGWAAGLKYGIVNYFGLQKERKNNFRRLPLAFSSQHLEKWRNRMIEIFFQMATCIETNVYPENESACPGAWGKHCRYTAIHEVLHPDLKRAIKKEQYEVKEKWEPWKIEEGIPDALIRIN